MANVLLLTCVLLLTYVLVLLESNSGSALPTGLTASPGTRAARAAEAARAPLTMLAVALAFVPAFVPTMSMRASPRTASPTMLEPPPKRIAVVGAGIGGLALARALQTLDTGVEDVAVFERRGELKPNIGGGIQINGGAAVLARLGLGEQMKASALPVRRILSRKSGGFELLDIDVESLVRGEPSLVDETGTPQAFSIMRDALQRMLADSLPAGTVRPEAPTLTLTLALALALTPSPRPSPKP